ncbi:hypothetical protein, partial [Frankia sp. AgB32]|uniref:hypothetical protein n=1 Tax=Frankia sp. AgB32 TaxID=631119 RepID=UPI0020106889
FHHPKQSWTARQHIVQRQRLSPIRAWPGGGGGGGPPPPGGGAGGGAPPPTGRRRPHRVLHERAAAGWQRVSP